MTNEGLKFAALALGVALVIVIIVLIVKGHKDKYEVKDNRRIGATGAGCCSLQNNPSNCGTGDPGAADQGDWDYTMQCRGGETVDPTLAAAPDRCICNGSGTCEKGGGANGSTGSCSCKYNLDTATACGTCKQGFIPDTKCTTAGVPCPDYPKGAQCGKAPYTESCTATTQTGANNKIDTACKPAAAPPPTPTPITYDLAIKTFVLVWTKHNVETLIANGRAFPTMIFLYGQAADGGHGGGAGSPDIGQIFGGIAEEPSMIVNGSSPQGSTLNYKAFGLPNYANSRPQARIVPKTSAYATRATVQVSATNTATMELDWLIGGTDNVISPGMYSIVFYDPNHRMYGTPSGLCNTVGYYCLWCINSAGFWSPGTAASSNNPPQDSDGSCPAGNMLEMTVSASSNGGDTGGHVTYVAGTTTVANLPSSFKYQTQFNNVCLWQQNKKSWLQNGGTVNALGGSCAEFIACSAPMPFEHIDTGVLVTTKAWAGGGDESSCTAGLSESGDWRPFLGGRIEMGPPWP